MGVRLLKEYKRKTKDAIKMYEDFFNSDFPTYHFEFGLSYFFPKETDFEETMITVINKCLEKKKDVYELGYFDVDDKILY